MKVIQTVSFISVESAGTSIVVPGLCHGLAEHGVDVELHTREPIPPRAYAYPVVSYPRSKWGAFLERSPAMAKGLAKACKSADIVQVNGVWMMPDVYPVWARRGTKCKLVTAPHGSFAPWSMRKSRWKKVLFGLAFQYSALRQTDLWWATAESEYLDIRRLGYKQPVAIVPCGIDLPDVGDVEKCQRRRMFFLSRIHPKKNLSLLIECWARLEKDFPDWDLSIVGPDRDNPYADEMKDLASRLDCRRITFEGELNGDVKWRFMAESECQVLPTHSENFGMVVAESLSCGTPVICSRGAPWKGLVDHRCGWWVAADAPLFEEAMREAMSLPRNELKEMGCRGREWMRRDFSWKEAGRKMRDAYNWLLGCAELPQWVQAGG